MLRMRYALLLTRESVTTCNIMATPAPRAQHEQIGPPGALNISAYVSGATRAREEASTDRRSALPDTGISYQLYTICQAPNRLTPGRGEPLQAVIQRWLKSVHCHGVTFGLLIAFHTSRA